MPINRGRIDGGNAPHGGARAAADGIDKTNQTAKNVHSVQHGKDVEEGAVRGSCEKQTLCTQLVPGESLAGQEGYAQSQSEVKPPSGGGEVRAVSAARDFKSQAAAKNDHRVQIKDCGQG